MIGHANDTKCFSRNVGRRTTSILINKDECGVVTTRSVQPYSSEFICQHFCAKTNDFSDESARLVLQREDYDLIPQRVHYEGRSGQSLRIADFPKVVDSSTAQNDDFTYGYS